MMNGNQQMNFVLVSINKGIAEVSLRRGKVNALNQEVVDELSRCFENLAANREVRAVIFTAEGPFFSFGFDIPEFLSYSKESFTEFLKRFTRLYAYLFTYSKPLVAALNGHAIAGGCMLALACDYRIMASGKARISLNEITFGSTVFAGSAVMLKSLVGGKNAQRVLYDGTMYSAEEALEIEMVDGVSSSERLMDDARELATRLATKNPDAFRSIKRLLRAPVAEEMARKEEESVHEFVSIWYSENTWKNLHAIRIRS
jgi:3,2-trans-enoyl-CoA isomerase